ncbi:hypothetical protein [Spartinivicinus poritis]|uniref:Uncharacterized protein n=1 Tax=Spartinivicinus poritis TaxID=2994640 RepID=A0ABT5UHP6_9GAMM|nr:hypothetical protein [Spartinivicinus sp. A2-2]MDE1465735.1 hypothetical protein [Spartinivicinus sp. A2-2]
MRRNAECKSTVLSRVKYAALASLVFYALYFLGYFFENYTPNFFTNKWYTPEFMPLYLTWVTATSVIWIIFSVFGVIDFESDVLESKKKSGWIFIVPIILGLIFSELAVN